MQDSTAVSEASPHPLRPWLKVVIAFILLDVVVFRCGLFWRLTPDFGADLAAAVWSQVYMNASVVERERPANAVTLVGSSVVGVGIFPELLAAQLGTDQVPANVVKLSTFGASCTDSALMAWSALNMRPWLVIYGAIPRDFGKSGYRETPVFRTFYDSSTRLPLVPAPDTATWLDGEVRHWWKLYRYRFFARAALRGVVSKSLDLLPASVFADEEPAVADDVERFPRGHVAPEAYAAWTEWRKTRRFSDYLKYLQLGEAGKWALQGYQSENMVNNGPASNPHVASLKWLLELLRRNHTRVVLALFPENPVFRDPEARPYLDQTLSDTYARLLRNDARDYGARFVDLRGALEAEDFYDLRHPNIEGARKLTHVIGQIIEEEWQARQQAAGAVNG